MGANSRQQVRKGLTILQLIAGASFGAVTSSAADVLSEISGAYPAQVALDNEGTEGYLFRRFPGAQRLYFYDLDSPNHSACNVGCDGPRPPVYAPCDAEPMPRWTIIKRYNGLCQWVYRGKPLYTFYHDLPQQPMGDGEQGTWHLLGYIKP